ncbi:MULTISPECIES: carboxyl transferase domain-containing protein [unclassified Bradyrhizobium]|uniref:acetyl-CoA carboxylase family protein n=1 Tax=unclassified Bradyrhizobium TaxID=2631580 RepID=UPI001BA9485D|nr:MULTISPECIES: carboxyl transferase domain-containing protein [unclassified Bradyrhizobium]MBR1228472.1 carbamoyl-phosphate synthase large subunit [Bradyrhizobium sp. AUGA SZCCT0176]MBR1297274.1 carbamoyl-phosphate synthase large subunit [Bradyrhizobium sp. AUGA SZCCT0042]
MTISALLIANRGEIAVRIARAAADLGIRTVWAYCDADEKSSRRRFSDDVVRLEGRGARAYLDQDGLVAAALQSGCDAVHPGYGFLSESADFARACQRNGLVFVGPDPATLEELGDKARARALARSLDVPLVAGTFAATSLAEVIDFVRALPEGQSAMIKAIAGGGGRGMRVVGRDDDVAAAFNQCQTEASKAFENGDLYVERVVRPARHIEVQIVGDGTDVAHVFERECSLQRRNQKLIEIAPSPTLDTALRGRITAAAIRLAAHFPYRGLGTFEFLVEANAAPGEAGFFFMEANPRLQVEHTVTEAITGIDLVQAQLQIAAGKTLRELGLRQQDISPPRGFAVEVRVNAEEMDESGDVRPAAGTIVQFEPPTGPGVRVDTAVHSGYRISSLFDSLIAKIIVHAPTPDYSAVISRCRRVLGEFTIGGVTTNLPFLRALLATDAVAQNQVDTRYVEEHLREILAAVSCERALMAKENGRIGHAQGEAGLQDVPVLLPEDGLSIATPIQGTVSALHVALGDLVRPGHHVAVVEAMKMEHLVASAVGGRVRAITAEVGVTVSAGAPLLYLDPVEFDDVVGKAESASVDLDAIRPDLATVIERHAAGLDAARPAAVARRRRRGQRTARENVDDLCDPGSFVEYGALAVAAQRQRRTMDQLIELSPADGLVAGLGTVNAASFGETRARCLVMSYDFTVFAGTQGWMNHKKKDRLFELAGRWKIPIVVFGEGGGGRPGETDGLSAHGLDTPSFARFARLSGTVPLVGIVSGRCFAGNAALVGCCDVIIATKDANLGMGGPAMIEGGGLGVYKPEEIGATAVQSRNGGIDLIAETEVEAVALAKRYLSYTQGDLAEWSCPDQRHLRHLIPENRRRTYDIRAGIEVLADVESVLELGRAFGQGIVTALIRIEGRALGVMANNATHLGGAIDVEAAQKATRFMDLCNSIGLPLLTLCDTPGFMVGPETEEQGQVRASCAMYLAAARLRVPVLTIILRKAYGLGAQAMAAGCFHAPVLNASWPTGEFGGMGPEGSVRLGYRKELEAIADPKQRQSFFEEKLAQFHEHGKAVNMASTLEIDAVIDPSETRLWIMRGLKTIDFRGRSRPGPVETGDYLDGGGFHAA